jgi:hypothetical protein
VTPGLRRQSTNLSRCQYAVLGLLQRECAANALRFGLCLADFGQRTSRYRGTDVGRSTPATPGRGQHRHGAAGRLHRGCRNHLPRKKTKALVIGGARTSTFDRLRSVHLARGGHHRLHRRICRRCGQARWHGQNASARGVGLPAYFDRGWIFHCWVIRRVALKWTRCQLTRTV